jgi:peroxin-14
MATVVGGVSYGLYSLGKRYVFPLVAPPTPERLEQDKKSIEEQFDKAFALVDQLAKDTEKLKEAEQQRTEKLDAAISELETVMTDLKTSNRRREDDAQRIREEVRSLKDAIPKAMDNQKSATDARLRDINSELTSLKTLVSQRMTPGSPSPAGAYVRSPGTAAGNRTGTPVTENTPASSSTEGGEGAKSQAQSGSGSRPWETTNGGSAAKASIPAWQLAMANKAKESAPPPRTATVEPEEPSSSQQEAGGSSSSSS